MNEKDATSKGDQFQDYVFGSNSEMDNKNLLHNRTFLRKIVSLQTGTGCV